jgi:NDP-sugar pyrophosphorylase family protein
MSTLGGILCGGLGKRLRPLTNSIPKSLIEIKEGYTILDRQLHMLKYAGLKEVYLLVGYLHDRIEERYGRMWKGLKLNYLVEERPMGTLYAINSFLFSADADRYVVMNGDIVTDISIGGMLKVHRPGEMTMAVTKLVSPYGIVELSGNKIIDFKEKPTLPYYINAGIYVIDKAIKPRFRPYEEGDVEKLVFPSLAKAGLINYYLEEVYWQSIDSPKDIEAVRKEFSNRTEKPWGYEKLIALTEKYMTKQIYIMKDFRTSLHYHREKDESLHALSGEGYVNVEGEEYRLSKGDVIRIPPGKKHYISASENLTLLEYSTPHPDDVVRVHDPYDR